jgi:hypothetical protein
MKIERYHKGRRVKGRLRCLRLISFHVITAEKLPRFSCLQAVTPPVLNGKNKLSIVIPCHRVNRFKWEIKGLCRRSVEKRMAAST